MLPGKRISHNVAPKVTVQLSGAGDGRRHRRTAQAIKEYNAASEGKVYLFIGSKITGGFCVTRKGLLEPSKLGHILTDNPALQNYQTAEDGGSIEPPSVI